MLLTSTARSCRVACSAQNDPSTSGLPTPPSAARSARLPANGAAVVVSTLAPPLAPAPPPRPLPVMHSPIYVQHQRGTRAQATDPTGAPGVTGSGNSAAAPVRAPEEYSGNALQWALRKLDDSLDEIEHNPSPAQKAMYDLSTGPVGQATTTGVQVAAKLTVTAAVTAVKVATPLGKWAVKEGFRAAVGLVGYAMEQDRQQRRRQQQSQREQAQLQAPPEAAAPVRQQQQQEVQRARR